MRRWLLIGGLILVLLVAGLAIGIKVFTKHVGQMTLGEAVVKAGRFLRIEYQEVKPNPASGTTKYRNLTITPRIKKRTALQIEECVVALRAGGRPGDLPQRLRLRLTGIRPIHPEALEGLARLGYHDLTLDLDLDLEYRPEEERFTVHEISLNASRAGDLWLYLDLTRLGLTLETTLAEALERFHRAGLVLAELRYSDDSLVDRLIAARAEEEKKKPEEVKGELLGHLGDKAGQEGNPARAEALAALARFIDHPGRLSARASPREPTSFYELLHLPKLVRGDWPADIDLEVKTE